MNELVQKSEFDRLTPDHIYKAVESFGQIPTGEILQLNSYENRVYDVKLESKERSHLIIKFYRPSRWTPAQISEEHSFLNELQQEGLPAIAPLTTSFDVDGFTVAIFPKVQARMPYELMGDDYKEIGRRLARLHNVGERSRFQHRPKLDRKTYGERSLQRLERFIAPDLQQRYFTAAETILDCLENEFDPETYIRVHGDCHRGNLLKTDPRDGSRPEYFFVDFDDSCMGPPEQDFFLLLSGSIESDPTAETELNLLLDGYEELRKAPKNLTSLEVLRGLRIIYYAGWIAARWNDKYFPKLFPAFFDAPESHNWWADETLRLEKIAFSL